VEGEAEASSDRGFFRSRRSLSSLTFQSLASSRRFFEGSVASTAGRMHSTYRPLFSALAIGIRKHAAEKSAGL